MRLVVRASTALSDLDKWRERSLAQVPTKKDREAFEAVRKRLDAIAKRMDPEVEKLRAYFRETADIAAADSSIA